MKGFILTLTTLLIGASVFGQCSKLTDHPKGKEFALRQFVYRDYVKAKDYEKAIPQWRDLYTHCRAGNGYILRDGETIFKNLAWKARKDKDMKAFKAYSDTVGIMITQRIECYGTRTRKSTGMKWAGYRYYLLGKHYIATAGKFDAENEENSPIILDYYKKAKEAFDNSMKADGKKVEANLVVYYSTIAVHMYRNNPEEGEPNISADDMRALYQQLMDIANENIENLDSEEKKN
jgi:hypothetical protein